MVSYAMQFEGMQSLVGVVAGDALTLALMCTLRRLRLDVRWFNPCLCPSLFSFPRSAFLVAVLHALAPPFIFAFPMLFLLSFCTSSHHL